MKRRGELRLICQAIRNSWSITDAGRQDAITLVRDTFGDDNATARERLAAVSVVLLMDQHNLLVESDEELLEQVKRLGAQA